MKPVTKLTVPEAELGSNTYLAEVTKSAAVKSAFLAPELSTHCKPSRNLNDQTWLPSASLEIL